MGTSAKYGGPSPTSALIPTFLDVLTPAIPTSEKEELPAKPETPENPTEKADQKPVPAKALPPLPPPSSAGRFKSSRSSFNVFAGTRDNTALRKSLSSYVRSGTGGGRGATRRMGSAISAVGKAIGFAQSVARDGIDKALSNLGLGTLIGQPAEQVLAVLTDVFCPNGGPIDQGIAREAWDEAVLELTELEIADVKDVSAEQWQALIVDFITRTIETKVINDVGTKGISLPQDVGAIDQLQTDLHELIVGAVNDAIGDRLGVGQVIPQNQIQGVVTDIYDRSFAYLEALEE